MRQELKAIHSNQKSFYKKAYYEREGDKINLYSYGTLVVTIKDNEYKLNTNVWEELLFSNTTKKHIVEFLLQFGIHEAINSKKWLKEHSVKQFTPKIIVN